MDTQELDQKIRRACRNTIGDAVGRSVARNPEKDALIFGGRRWSYAELDAGPAVFEKVPRKLRFQILL